MAPLKSRPETLPLSRTTRGERPSANGRRTDDDTTKDGTRGLGRHNNLCQLDTPMPAHTVPVVVVASVLRFRFAPMRPIRTSK